MIQIAYLSQSNFIKIFEKKEKEVIEKILEERQFGFDKVNNGSLELPDIIRHVLIDLDKNGVSNSFSFSEWYAEIISIPLQIAKKYPYEEKTIRAILPVILSQVEEERNDMLYRLNINGRWELADAIRVVIYSDRNKFL
ncbi:MAG: hypothetical protein HZT40_04185 [Candidatus Thiothrix singaporensis]|uniref:Uncharacterized protein n=1 Tax=Candidatus Thiothrix singaporensis TaxID=2799669 RepID=A0A7L6AP94_9GAMM|nr:MAG: hypothetical protein HZT40_04185 [Candidatus Thiothrix singaporensis]